MDVVIITKNFEVIQQDIEQWSIMTIPPWRDYPEFGMAILPHPSEHFKGMKKLQNTLPPLLLITQNRIMSTSKFDPPYLDSLKPKIPLYDPLNIQIKGFDFAVLESYQKEIHRIARILDIDVAEGWATPGVKQRIQKFKPNSSLVEQEYFLTTYERNLQVVDLPSTVAPIFIELIQAAQPQGTDLQVHAHEQEHETIRYVPDMELKELKTQLTDLGGPVKKK